VGHPGLALVAFVADGDRLAGPGLAAHFHAVELGLHHEARLAGFAAGAAWLKLHDLDFLGLAALLADPRLAHVGLAGIGPGVDLVSQHVALAGELLNDDFTAADLLDDLPLVDAGTGTEVAFHVPLLAD